jgi:hypothetical protein
VARAFEARDAADLKDPPYIYPRGPQALPPWQRQTTFPRASLRFGRISPVALDRRIKPRAPLTISSLLLG